MSHENRINDYDVLSQKNEHNSLFDKNMIK